MRQKGKPWHAVSILWDYLFHETVITFKAVYLTHFKEKVAGRKESITKTVRMMLKVQMFQITVLQNIKSSFTGSAPQALGCRTLGVSFTSA